MFQPAGDGQWSPHLSLSAFVSAFGCILFCSLDGAQSESKHQTAKLKELSSLEIGSDAGLPASDPGGAP